MDWLNDPNAWIGLLTLIVLEIVLGIDNVIFISILSGKLPAKQQNAGRTAGLALAMLTRILLLFSLSWIIGLTRPLLTVAGLQLTGRGFILLAGGLFLLAKGTHEIHDQIEGETEHENTRVAPSFISVLIQIALLDIVFSLDSVLTAVGMVDEVSVMIIAVVLAMAVMMVFAGPISRFVQRHPTIKTLALSFLLLIGVNLIAEGVGFHIPKGYTYFAMGFALLVEMINLKIRGRRSRPRQLRSRRLRKAIDRIERPGRLVRR